MKLIVKKMVQVIIPIAHNNHYFPKKDFYFPKPLVEVAGHPMIVQVVKDRERRLNIDKLIFVLPRSLENEFSLASILKLNTKVPTSIVLRDENNSGGLCSSLMAIDELDQSNPVIVMNMDEILNINLQTIVDKFIEKRASAGLISFSSTHPRWCYAITDNQFVKSCTEKKVVSKEALAGFYFFKNKEIFVQSASQAMLDDDQCDGKYYLSAAINQIILRGDKVLHEEIQSNNYFSFFSPEMIREFETSSYSEVISKKIRSSVASVNVVIPAAGDGSRFAKERWKAPKPFIDINGKLMIEHIIENLKIANSKVTLILRKEHILNRERDLQRLEVSSSEIVKIDELTEGTISTVLLARKLIDNDQPLLIANSDQIVDFDCNELINDCNARNLDGSILVFKDPFKDPKWSFVKVSESGYVEEVAEKKAISNLATVGIYYFNNGSEFVQSAIDMIVRNERVNGEFYTCPVYNYMISKGLKIGVYEISYESMQGIGTPEDLITYMKKMNFEDSKHKP
tara:strand:+ start:2692 stop:4227 length:1536 start_codon:yes stop_codon:yes gene_type:complete